MPDQCAVGVLCVKLQNDLGFFRIVFVILPDIFDCRRCLDESFRGGFAVIGNFFNGLESPQEASITKQIAISRFIGHL